MQAIPPTPYTHCSCSPGTGSRKVAEEHEEPTFESNSLLLLGFLS